MDMFLYGPEVLETVAQRAAEMADALNKSGNLPCKVVYKATVKTDAEITQVMKDANYDESCYGVITWCHTFSPSKMWIHGFGLLQKPYCHLATQYNRKIPNEEIDMDFMNLNQAAHGDGCGRRWAMPSPTSCALSASATTCGMWPSPRATRWRPRSSWAGRWTTGPLAIW